MKINPLVLLILFLVFFTGANVLSTFDIQQSLYFLFLFFICFLSSYKIKKRIKEIPQAWNFLIFTIGYWVFKMYIDKSPGVIMMGIIAFTPVLVYLVTTSLIPINKRVIYKKILYLFYIIECGIAILERLTKQLVFGLKIEDEIIMSHIDSVIEFRSNALFGHPLQNSLIVLIFILFILLYESNIKLKFSLAIIGILAIFCFNTRAAIVISCGTFLVYLFFWLKNSRSAKKTKIIIALIFSIASLYLISLFNSGSIGGRLLSMGLYDASSASARVKIWELFYYIDPSSFIIGQDYYFIERILNTSGFKHVENYWLIWFLYYGLIFVVFIFFFYWKLFVKIFKYHSTYEKTFLLVPFLVCATTNNSLCFDFVPLTAFLLLSYIFSPDKDYTKRN